MWLGFYQEIGFLSYFFCRFLAPHSFLLFTTLLPLFSRCPFPAKCLGLALKVNQVPVRTQTTITGLRKTWIGILFTLGWIIRIGTNSFEFNWTNPSKRQLTFWKWKKKIEEKEFPYFPRSHWVFHHVNNLNTTWVGSFLCTIHSTDEIFWGRYVKIRAQ